MRVMNRGHIAALLLAICAGAQADPAVPGCFWPEVQAHVRQQFAIYGPLSIQNEYFGFIYRRDALISSAVTRSAKCESWICELDVGKAGALIPVGARVLGEWHTHPHDGSAQLSIYDVRGAYQNHNLECYAAYYSKPNGDILAWYPRRTSVATAMASGVLIGNYGARSG
jgi:hypothetical protein